MATNQCKFFQSLKYFQAITLCLISTIAHGEEIKSLTFGIVPQQSASKLARLWSPILKHVSNETGIKIYFRTAPNIPEFEKRLYQGDYDIAYMNPYHYITFNKTNGYRAFAKQKDKRIQGIIVARKDSNLKSLNELSNKLLAFPSPAAFAATLLPQAQLKLDKVNHAPKYVSSHDSVYRSVAAGLYPAGGGIVRTFNNVDPKVHSQLKILWGSTKYTPHAFAAHPRIQDTTIAKIKAAMLKMVNHTKASKMLKDIRFNGIVSAEDHEWDDVRKLDIKAHLSKYE